MAQRTKSTRVVFREETICNYTDTKFLQSNPQCSIREVSSVVEEFDPVNPIIGQDQFDFIIHRNEAIPQPLLIPASTPAARDTTKIITTLEPTQIVHQDPSLMLRAGRQNIPNMGDAVQNVINRQQYVNRLSDLNQQGSALDDLPDKSQLTQRQIEEMYYDPFAEIESFNKLYDRFIAGTEMYEMAIPEVPENIKNAPNAELNSKKYIMEEVVRRLVADGEPIRITGGTEITPEKAFEKITEGYEKSNRAFDFINAKDAGVLTPEQKQTLALTKEINDSIMKARGKSKSSTRILLDEAVATPTTEGTELTNLRTTEALKKGYGTQTQRGSAGQGSSTDPITQPVDSLNINMLSHGLPSELLTLSFDMPPELSNLKIPQMPDPSKVSDMASYRIEKSIYDTKLADLYKAIDGTHKIDGYTKEILKKQIAIHELEVELRVRIANNPVTIDDRTNVFGSEFNEPNLINLEANKFQVELNKLYIQQEIYNELRSIPTADRGVTLAEMQSNSTNFVEYFQNTTGKPIAHSEFIEAIGKVTETITTIELKNPQVTQIQPQQLSSMSNAIKSIKYSQTFKQINTAALGKALVHTTIGFGVSMAVAHLAGEAKVFQNIEDIYQRGAAIGALVGGTGTLPQIAARFFAIAMRGAAIQAGETALAATSRALITASITSIGEIVAGGIVGAALVPLDMLFQDFLLKNGFNKAGAGALSGATMAAIGTVTSLAIAATVESIEAGALTLGAALAPESLGLSVVVALGTMAFAAIVGAAMGGFTDDRARRDKDTFNINRKWIMDNLAKNNYDVIGTFQDFERQKYNGKLATDKESRDDFGDYETEMRPFIEMLQEKFEGRTFDKPKVQYHELNEKEKEIQRIMSKDLLPTLRDIALKDGNIQLANSIRELPDYEELTQAEWDWMDKATDKTWFRESLLAGQIQYEDLKYAQIRSGPAQVELTRIWNETHSLEYPPELVKWATKDASFSARFTQQRMFDAQRIIMENFQNNGKLLNENEANVITMACTPDPFLTNPPDGGSNYAFRVMFNDYTNNMANTADSMNISVRQLIDLQRLPEERRARTYLQYQYNTLRENNLTRDEIENLQRYDEQNRAVFARGFYSRDDEILALMPPEEYDTWNPLASQLYQAQEAGMTLRQYVDYMHLLSMGDRGDFNNLPEYSPADIIEQKIQDRHAFQVQLDRTGNTSLLIFDEATQRFVINPANLASPAAMMAFADRLDAMPETNYYYNPKAFESDENFHTMTSGMNEQNQLSYDAYNYGLATDIEEFRAQYERQAAEYNEYQHITGQQNFMYFDAQAEFHSRKLTYTPMSTNVEDYVTDYKAPPPRPNLYDTTAGKPPKLSINDNIYDLLSDENRRIADNLIADNMEARSGDMSENERQYIYRQVFNQQYYDSQQEQDYWTRRTIMHNRLEFANEGMNPETATDADRANNLHMELNQYYEWLGSLPTTDEMFFQNHTTAPEEEEEEEKPEEKPALITPKTDAQRTLTPQQQERADRQASKNLQENAPIIPPS